MTTKVTFKAKQGESIFPLRTIPAMPNELVRTVTVDGVPATFTVGAFDLQLSTPLISDGTVVVEISFR